LQASLADLAGARGQGPPVLLVTAHRRESWGPRLRSVGQALRDIAIARPDVVVVVPLHANPTVRDAIVPQVSDVPNIRLVEPLSYPEFAVMMRRSHLVLTDSGGVQEEAPSVGTPVLIMRDTTERPEAVAAGTARLVGTDRKKITEEVLGLLSNDRAREAMAHVGNPFGDGRASLRVVAALRHLLFGDPKPDDFEAVMGRPSDARSPAPNSLWHARKALAQKD
jgi:UDP-N-acetylglucosamine 2-epimerase (non-hydrolysing)